MKVINHLKQKWEKSPAQFKQRVVIGLVCIAVLGAIYLFVSSNPAGRSGPTATQRNVFDIKDFESRFGLSGGKSELEQMQQGNKKTSELDRLQQENRKLQKQLELMLKSRSSAGNAPESK